LRGAKETVIDVRRGGTVASRKKTGAEADLGQHQRMKSSLTGPVGGSVLNLARA